MSLINLYLEEIRHHLPPKNRDDILKEIRSTLIDMIEDRTQGQTQDDEVIKSVLIEFGPPRKVAREFGAKNYLIGPIYFPTYLQVLKIVLIVVAILNLLGLITAVVNPSAPNLNVIEAILEIVGGLFASLFTAFGIVTLSFAGIERSSPEDWKPAIDRDWSPEDLEKIEKKERINITGLAIEITMGFVFIAVLNFFLDRIGIYYLSNTGWVSAPILNENFLPYIPWITAYTAMGVVLNLYLIRKGFWDKFASLSKVLINAFTAAVLIAIITGPAIISISPTAWQTLNLGLESNAHQVSNTLNTIMNILLSIAIFGLVVDSIKRVYMAFIKNSDDKVKFTTE